MLISDPNRRRTQERLPVPGLIALLVLAVVVLSNSCSTVPREVFAPPQIPGANYVGNKTCSYCHTNYTRVFSASPHARVRFDASTAITDAGCESCHGPGSKHVEVGGGRGKFIVNPGKDPAACFQCHLETHAEFNLPQHHPVVEGRMNCVQCHDPHGFDIMKPAGGLAMARLNETCARCHREQTRPSVFEHEALREGCVTCHAPHGSINRKMLVDIDNSLCLRCHAQIQQSSDAITIGAFDHSTLLNQATCWASGCHTAVHGSNVDPWLRY
jgi:predicted CXXCH cytochrome family protein